MKNHVTTEQAKRMMTTGCRTEMLNWETGQWTIVGCKLPKRTAWAKRPVMLAVSAKSIDRTYNGTTADPPAPMLRVVISP
jgi:hypothetical protein